MSSLNKPSCVWRAWLYRSDAALKLLGVQSTKSLDEMPGLRGPLSWSIISDLTMHGRRGGKATRRSLKCCSGDAVASWCSPPRLT